MSSLSETFQQLLQTNQLNGELVASIVMFSVVAFVGWLSYFALGRYFSKWISKTKTNLDDNILSAVKIIIIILIVILGIEYALSPLSFLQPYGDTLSGVFLVLQIMLGAFAVTRVSNIVADWYAGRSAVIIGQNSRHMLFLLKKIVQITVLVFAILLVLYAFNVDLTGALVGLGVGGIAIAFALQNTLSDFFSAFSIYFDRPFEIGDFIVVGDHSGTVTNIGVKSTRLKLLQGEELVVSNKELTSASVRNFRKLEKRRITFTIGVTYDTPLQKLKKIPQIVTCIIDNVDNANLERVHFTEFGDCSLKFLISYYVNSSDYAKYLDTQQQINFAIKEEFEREAIEMAFPTTTIYVKK
jgi:small-conductance mechanosensitive channel